MPDTLIRRRAVRRPNTFDREARTFDAVLATGAVVAGVRLPMDALEVPENVPVQLDHDTSVRQSVGRVVRTWHEGDALVGTIQLSADPSLSWLAERIADGTITGVSIGFAVTAWARSEGAVRVVGRARLVELSLVSTPADAAATIRSMTMEDQSVAAETATETTTEDTRAERRSRAREVRTLCRSLGLSSDFADTAIDEDLTDAELHARAIAELRNRAPATIRTAHNTDTRDNPETFRRAATGAMIAHMGGAEPEGLARELAGAGWVGLHREILRAAGHSVAGLSDEEVIRRALTTSDMPLISDPATNQTVRQAYEAAASPTAQLFGSRTIANFNPHHEVLVDWTTLAMNTIGELGEYRASYITEGEETYKLFTIGGKTGVSRQLYINGGAALGNLGRQLGRRLAADVNDRRIAFLTQAIGAGPTMKDGTAVFDATRENIETLDTKDLSTVINSALAARAKMPKRKGAGNVMIGATPRFWLVSTGFEPTGIRALASVSATAAGDVNPLAGRLELIAEPRLADDDVSYLVAAPGSFDGAVEARLAGAPGPVTESRWGFDTDAYEVKIRLDLGFGWLDWRSWTRLDHEASA